MKDPGRIYLIHIERKVGRPQSDAVRAEHQHGPRVRPYQAHAQHRLGHAEDLEERIHEHRSGQGSPLLRYCNEHGIGWDVVRTWKGGHKLERKLSRQKNNPLLCPVCNPDGWQSRGTYDREKKRGSP